MIPRPSGVTHLRKLGASAVASELQTRVASRGVEFGLKCDLAHLPGVKPAKVPLTLQAYPGAFDGFDAELERATGADYGRTLRRKRLQQHGVRTMHAALDAEGTPVYVQWLVTAGDKPALDQEDAGYWPPLADDQVLLEFAYTFLPFRGLGIMADAMSQLLHVAAATGAASAFTYVRSDNIASLRGCAKVGFDADHVKTVAMRLGARRTAIRPLRPEDTETWRQATAARRSG